MTTGSRLTVDGNEAVASVAYRLSEAIAIYPITPASPMGEAADEWCAGERLNAWGHRPEVIELQSEAGAAGTLHGAMMAGALTSTFTSSQGLLLMIPNMYKIAGELTPTVFHIAARALATQALSIFGDHSDVMAARATGFAMLASNSVQEASDLALISHAATLNSRIPFMHFFDGFRTSHEVATMVPLSDEDLLALMDENKIRELRQRALTPDRPAIRGTAQNPDVYFQSRETVNRFYNACPEIVQSAMDALGERTGRRYQLFQYYGAPDATRVIVMMGSGCETAKETIDALMSNGEKVGLLEIHLFRPFSIAHFLKAIPRTVTHLAVLDRTKEVGATGEPLYQDVITALMEGRQLLPNHFLKEPTVIGGRYGLGSKEFTPGMVKSVFDELLKTRPRNHFMVGITDDVTNLSLEVPHEFSTEAPENIRAVFYGLGSDGTVGANKNSIKIIGEDTHFHAQGYFVYDSKKSGSTTVSHLRFGPKPIRSSYLITRANFVACHQFRMLERIPVLDVAAPGATFLLNSPHTADEVWNHLPKSIQQIIIDRKLRFYVVDGDHVAEASGMGKRINTVLQACFFAISGVLPRDEAIAKIKQAIYKTYGKRGEAVVQRNYAAVDMALDFMFEVRVPAFVTASADQQPPMPDKAPDFVRHVLGPIFGGAGDQLPVSAMPVDGAYPTATAQWEKRNIGHEIPVWDHSICIQCGKCAFVCPHAVIREKVVPAELVKGAPASFVTIPARWKELEGTVYRLQVSPEDCTSCGLCVEVCPVKNKSRVGSKAINMTTQEPLREQERANWDYFLSLPDIDREKIPMTTVKNTQLLRPLFEFSGACAGCGETPYLKLLSQLFGDRAMIANATGCSSIYGGSLPTTPWASNSAGRGPAWANSLFEDNAEFGLGMRVALDRHEAQAGDLLKRIAPEHVAALLNADQSTEAGIRAQRERVSQLKAQLLSMDHPLAQRLANMADYLVKKSVWIVGGDGWAYDIGFGGLDHVFGSGRNVNILVLDTEVYSNTGGQASKSTPRGAIAKFAAGGKGMPKKDLGLMAMSYGHVYVARIAMGADDGQTVKAFVEAEAYNGPSIIIAYSHCIAHGYDLIKGLDQQKLAVKSGHWPLFRFNPALAGTGQNPLQLDSSAPSIKFQDYAMNENRYRALQGQNPDRAASLMKLATQDAKDRWSLYEQRAQQPNEERS